MDEQRQQAYLTLINALLTCPSGEEGQTLQDNAELVDAGLVKTMAQVAEVLAERGDENGAQFLIGMANQLGELLGLSTSTATPEAQLDFLMQVLKTTSDSDVDPQVVYPLLQENLHLLDDNFARILYDWATAKLAELQPAQAKSIAIDIGNFSNLIQEFPLGSQATNQEIAITGYEVALTFFTCENHSKTWATLQNNLGAAYSDRIRGERAENIESAIASYQAALQIYTRDAFPSKWAMTQTNLGAAYRNRIRGERAENIELAIASFQSALEVYTRQAFPSQWALIQNNLGTVYYFRIRGEREENIELAIAFYQSALEVYTCEAFPSDWAMTKNNLGNAYSNRIRGERAENIESAIAFYQAALEVYTRDAFPSQWATTQNNLGAAYYDRIRGERAENIESAIASFQSALEVYTRDAFPSDWANTQNNLGTAYGDRIRGERAENIESAIASFQAAMAVYTRDAFPSDWAMTQNNLGNAYLERIRGEVAENIESAIASYQAALEVRTREAFPQNYIETQFNLGRAYRDAQQLDNAYDAFAAGIDTVEFQRVEISLGTANDADKQKLAEEWNKLYLNMIEVCLELADNTQAWEYIERSKTRNLIELLTSRSLYPDGEIPTQIKSQLQQLQQEILIEQRRLNQLQAAGEQKLLEKSITVEEIDYSHINQLRQRYNELYPYKPLKFDQLSPLIDKNTAIIEWYIFDDCFRAVIINDLTPQPPSQSPSFRRTEDASLLFHGRGRI
ncbi:MAG: tetratricopeptide repeat protein [Coleofasciculus chthonoplastes F3-SA18-01]|uniref:tetratricopeptide repeat protein n=1 Tax=Coleofasciculus chthonoplastes TaxID=64178 RepID=UPI0032F3F3A6